MRPSPSLDSSYRMTAVECAGPAALPLGAARTVNRHQRPMDLECEPADVHRLIHRRAARAAASPRRWTRTCGSSPSHRAGAGSITVSHTRSMGASMSILAETVLIGPGHTNVPRRDRRVEPRPAASACRQRLLTLPVGQRVLDRGVK